MSEQTKRDIQKRIHNGDITESGIYDCEVVTGYVYASNGGTIELPNCTTVGGSVDAYKSKLELPKLKRKDAQKAANRIISNRLKKLGYIWADGILQELAQERKTKTGTVYKTKLIGKDKTNYVIEVDGVFAHGDTIKRARESFMFKIADRDTSAYEGWTLDKVITKLEAIQSYRVITGACETGTRQFVQGVKAKGKYKVSEVIELTKGQFGNEEYSEFMKERSER